MSHTSVTSVNRLDGLYTWWDGKCAEHVIEVAYACDITGLIDQFGGYTMYMTEMKTEATELGWTDLLWFEWWYGLIWFLKIRDCVDWFSFTLSLN